MKIQYQIQFHDFWHTGSGLSGGVLVDSEVIKTDNGLPYIPGKTLKGLIRDAAKILSSTDTGLLSNQFIEGVLGSKTNTSSCHFSNAYLSAKLQQYLGEDKQIKDLLYQSISSTAIDQNGQAIDNSLRAIEVTVPIVLYAEIHGFPDDQALQDSLNYCFQYIKRMGHKRHRGLGRCDWSILNKEEI